MLLRLLVLPFCLLLAPALASADQSLVGSTCDGQADCPAAFTCQVVEVVDCAPSAPMCDCPGCPEGEDCPSCDCGGDPGEPEDDCAPTSEQRCVFEPQPCTTDAECTTAGFVCWVEEECSGGGCACPPCVDGGDCPPCDCDGMEDEVECTVTGGWCWPEEQPCGGSEECRDGWECGVIPGRGGGGSGEDCACACAPCEAGVDCEPCDCSCGGEAGEGGGRGDDPRDEPGSGDPGDQGDPAEPLPPVDRMCMPAGWEAQLAEMIGVGEDDDAGSGAPRGVGEELAGNAPGAQDGAPLEDDNVIESAGCSAAGPGLSLLAAAAALGLALRRPR